MSNGNVNAEQQQAVRLYAKWEPKPEFKLGPKDIDRRQTYLGSLVWRNPQMKVEDVGVPKPGPGEVLLQVRACGICGSDVHMAQPDDHGYIWYPGLTGFPCTLGHELAGVVVEAEAGRRSAPVEMYVCDALVGVQHLLELSQATRAVLLG